MNLSEAKEIYKHPKGHSKEELTECLKILNAQPRKLTLAEQVVIADAHNRLDILNGVIDAEYTIKGKPKIHPRRGQEAMLEGETPYRTQAEVLEGRAMEKGSISDFEEAYLKSEEEMKLLICGDRNWKSKFIIKQYIEHFQPSLVIEGECRGADILARQAAKELGIPVSPHRAKWELYGLAAGPIRNREMLDEKPDLVLAFHFDIANSSGTADTLCEADRRGIEYALIGI